MNNNKKIVITDTNNDESKEEKLHKCDCIDCKYDDSGSCGCTTKISIRRKLE